MKDYRFNRHGIEVGADLASRAMVLRAEHAQQMRPTHLPARRRVAPGTRPLTYQPFASLSSHPMAVSGFFDDVGSGIASAAKGVASGAKTAVKAVESVANKPAQLIHNAALAISPNVLDKYVAQVFPSKAVSIPTSWKELKDEYNKNLPVAQTILRNCGPWGMAASGALGAVGAAINGGSLEEIAWAAAEGASPTYIQMAVAAAKAIRAGGGIKDMAVNAALDAGSKYFDQGSAASVGFEAAKKLVKGGSLTDAAIAAAKAKMSPAQKTGFDVAIGTIARASAGTVKGQPSALTAAGKALPSAAVLTAAGKAKVTPPPKKVSTVAMKGNPDKLKKPGLVAAKNPPKAVKAVAKKAPVKTVAASTATRPKPLGPQPKLAGKAAGTLITSDGKKQKGSFKVAASGKAGIAGLLVLSDGRIVRELFEKA